MSFVEPPAEESRELREALILDLARSRPGFGAQLTGDVRAAERSSPTCGDRIRIRVEVRDGVLARAAWDGRGCAISTASAGVLSQVIRGTALEQLPRLLEEVRAVVGPGSRELPGIRPPIGEMPLFAGTGRLPLRGRCALLAWEALAEAVRPLGDEQATG